jgi:hypothetical protein
MGGELQWQERVSGLPIKGLPKRHTGPLIARCAIGGAVLTGLRGGLALYTASLPRQPWWCIARPIGLAGHPLTHRLVQQHPGRNRHVEAFHGS